MSKLIPNPAYGVYPFKDEFRPPLAERWIEGMREAPAVIEVHTTWLYSAYDPRVIVPAGRTRHPFSRGGEVVASSIPEPEWSDHRLIDYVKHAIAAFGDDAHLEIIIRKKETTK